VNVRPVLGLALVAGVVATAASAAGDAPLRLVPSRPIMAGHTATLVVRATRPQPEKQLRLVLVAPRANMSDVVAAASTGGVSEGAGTAVELPRDGFLVHMTRHSAESWRVSVRFPRPGRWRLVVPNWAEQGVTTPYPLAATVLVKQ
jgi:hypothetical protein